jgi:hypothetical protein
MTPEDVKPAKFRVHTIIYNEKEFSVAYGHWEEEDDIRLAMRWNGGENGIGYPSQGGNPLWFQLPSDSIWTSEILQAVERIAKYEKRIKELNEKIL